MNNEDEILSAIAADEWMMEVIHTVESLKLPDWWICAGFVRSKVWDILHGYVERTPTDDIDVIFYDRSNRDETVEKDIENQLNALMPGQPWSVKNQARMHEINGSPPYLSSTDAISRFPETPTAVGVSLNTCGELELTAPLGLADLLALKVRPTPAFEKDEHLIKIYRQRVVSKDWIQKWPRLEIACCKNAVKG